MGVNFPPGLGFEIERWELDLAVTCLGQPSKNIGTGEAILG